MRDASGSFRSYGPTYKEKGAVQRSVTALLDELAPEPSLTRSERPPAALQLHRTPTGCVLQRRDCAVSISWLADESGGGGGGGGGGQKLGELFIVVWRGTVARRGATRHTKGATIVSELSLHPIHPPERGFLWRASDGTEYDTDSLVARCLTLLRDQCGDP